MRWLTLAAAVLLLSAVAESASGVSYYTVTDLGTLGGSASAGLGINDSGQVVGYAYNSSYAQPRFSLQQQYDDRPGHARRFVHDRQGHQSTAGRWWVPLIVNNAYRALSATTG